MLSFNEELNKTNTKWVNGVIVSGFLALLLK